MPPNEERRPCRYSSRRVRESSHREGQAHFDDDGTDDCCATGRGTSTSRKSRQLGGARPEDISALQWQTRYFLGVPLVMTLVSSAP